MDAKTLAELTIAAVKNHIDSREGELISLIKSGVDDKISALETKIDSFPVPDISHLEVSINEQLEKAIKAIPAPEKGEKGEAGESGKDASPDDVAKAMEGYFSKWALDFERKADLILEKAIDRIPKPKDGKDALELEDFDIEVMEDGRSIKMSLSRGDEKLEKTVKLAVILDRGVYKDGSLYEKGDSVSYGGSAYVAQLDNPQGKPGGSKDWRLQVKRGRDAKEPVMTKEKPEIYKIGN